MDLFSSSGKSSVDGFQKLNFLKYLTVDTLSTLSRKQKSGFLSVIQQIFEVFHESHVRPFLDFLMGCVVRLLVNYAPHIDDETLFFRHFISFEFSSCLIFYFIFFGFLIRLALL